MAKEIERKFLVLNDDWRASVRKTIAIRQFYLGNTGEGRSCRVRLRDGAFATLTLKFGEPGRVRDEFEYPMPLDDARELEAFAIGRVIEKVRHLVPHGRWTFEIDAFSGFLQGLVIAELETADDVPDASLPGWLGREVTGLRSYYNSALTFDGVDVAVLAGAPA